ncbi:probable plastid-lipid-associated protein 10, chloroplastic isoform X2 [Cornus florida]|uniref:probable plastid-lipid-associated protein 10, chloroplastic isoform X2 n=1 Tax=Cornus florida TaxID=4283 RepID=UPI00289993E2|nr:probable plastid-lipid-associated protein 10, chloroplastic isoform X2 [Cornus florida]
MDLAFASSLQYPLTGNRSVGAKAKTFVSTPNAERNLSFRCLAREVAIQHRARVGALFGFPFQDQENVFEIENRKQHLLKAIQETQRGLVTTAHQRSSIEEALVSVESYDSGEGEPIDLNKLDGTWRLQYTSAPDVLILLEAAARLPFFQVGQIFQKFECQGQSDGGFVRNVVRWSIPNLLEEQEGATLLVSAKFSVISLRNIYLQFEEIAVQNINISEELQALVAPAILPRSFLSLLILQSIRAFKAQVPVRESGGRQSVGGLYYLSYLDGNMLLGRTVGGGSVFVFTRAQPLIG